MKINFETLSQEILNSNSFILTTHKDCDADGLGSILALHFALTKMGKKFTPYVSTQFPKI